MEKFCRPLFGALLALLAVSCQPRRFNESSTQSVGAAGNSFAEELLSYHRNTMAPDLANKLGDLSFYVFNRGCAAGRAADEVARRPIDGARDPAYYNSPDPFPHQDTCQNSYIDPANYDMRGVVRRRWDSSPGSSSAGTPRFEGQSSIVDVFQVPPNGPRFKKRCYNSLPSGRAIYRVFNKQGSSFNGMPYYEIRSHDVTVGVMVDIQRVVNEGLDRSSSDQLDLESGFYPRVYLMPGLCGVSSPAGSGIGKTPGGFPGTLPPPGGCNPSTQNPTGQNPVCSGSGGTPGLPPGSPTNPTTQQPNPATQQPNPTIQQPNPANPAQQNPVLVPRSPNGTSQQ